MPPAPDEDLPTKYKVDNDTEAQVVQWRKVKKKVMDVTAAKNKESRQQHLNQLLSLSWDEEAEKSVGNFLNQLDLYHTMDEPAGYSPNVR